ncbi:protein of unknown function (DUF397) [Streptoalloteichus tenebrarius]|uniref:DUF397 domain-containing protein n=1 Tax=Streptoalloteichus tenebrarius (strain ATCC 17920 / DSM 40477 / JCM 4838 / CBS 697.72 / NBRC 16177 / NCIMB 11028 / NRRL B-12390 / A12253. 1 / ISP 5477) TaxID=1933 RepID=A0ABT1HWV1_STRSD|nr:DUF397 domain-containing protein [Streptoalloteichus tenebrarius]MCP2260012.1 protein of unknown function (DUF397) [Streptoalloteichus tenebrarius]BFF03875.1 hypothetical protein GCM10020241_55500 [Streptoalloteichus tenebrarius]
MLAPDLTLSAPWRKSTRSNNGAHNCVEVAPAAGAAAAVRDSKNPNGPALLFAPSTFHAFVNTIKTGRLDLS